MSQRATAFTASPFFAFPAGDVSARPRHRAARAESLPSANLETPPSRSQLVRNPKNTVPAVNRALDLVQLLAEDGAETHTKALALRLGVPHTTCYRILRSLMGRGWVQRLANGRHALAPALTLVQAARQSRQELRRLGAPPAVENPAPRADITALRAGKSLQV